MAGSAGLLLGLAFYFVSALEQRLRESVARLKEAEFAETGGPGDLLDRLVTSVRAATGDTLQDDWTALLLERTRSPGDGAAPS